MANVDNPRGFYPVRHFCGGNITMQEFVVTTGQTIYRGDLVSMINSGTVTASTANDGIIIAGVAAEYVTDAASAGGKKIMVYADPWIVFGVQCDTGTSPAATDIFATANHVAGSGSSTTKLSGHELDASDIGSGQQMRILGLVNEPNNAWGEHCDVEVLLVEHGMNDTTNK